MVPAGTPGALAPFMVLIELLRGLIRPITLSVRLAANIVAGHLLLTLIRGQAISPLVVVVILSLGLMFLLEMGVRVIQAYVFRVLGVLYHSEINTKVLIR